MDHVGRRTCASCVSVASFIIVSVSWFCIPLYTIEYYILIIVECVIIIIVELARGGYSVTVMASWTVL